MADEIMCDEILGMIKSFPNDSLSSGDSSQPKSDICSSNGDLKFGLCESVPNNNVQSDATGSQCSSDMECANNTVSSPDTVNSSDGINPQHPVQQCEVQSSNCEGIRRNKILIMN